MRDKKYNRYQFARKWCESNICKAVADFDETLCSQAKSYILRMFEAECNGNLPDIDNDSYWYQEDMYWLGYLITYWSFFDGTSGLDIARKYDICKILDEYDALHTLSLKSAIDKIQEDDRLE